MQNANKTRGVGPLGGSGVVAQWGASSLIASVQRGTFSNGTNTSGTQTITAVVPANCVAIVLGSTSNNSGSAQAGDVSQWSISGFANSTTLNFTRAAANGVTRSASWEVREFQPGVLKSVQFVSVNTSTNASGTGTITAVNTAKSFLIPCGWQQQTVSQVDDVSYAHITLTNATTVTISRLTAAGNNVLGYACVVEFF